MAKKRSAASKPEEEEEEAKREQDVVMDVDMNDEDLDIDSDDLSEGGEELDEEEEEDDDDGNGSASAAGNDVKVGIPSPAGEKDMHLRSGKRKRRRSKETTGLTPPDGNDQRQHRKKRARTDTEKKAARPANGEGRDGPAELPTAAPIAASLGPSAADPAAAVAGYEPSGPERVGGPRRISFSLALAFVTPGRRGETLPSQEDAGRGEEQDRDGAMVPPKPGPPLPPSNGGTNGAKGGRKSSLPVAVPQIGTVETGGTATAGLARAQADERADAKAENGVHEDEDLSTSKRLATMQHLLSVLFMVLLALLTFKVGPGMVKVADVLIPLDAGLLPSPTIPVIPIDDGSIDDDDEKAEVEFIGKDPEIIEEIVTEAVEHPAEELNAWNQRFTDTLNHLEQLKEDFLSSTDRLYDEYNESVERVQWLRSQLATRRQQGLDRLGQLSELEHALARSIDSRDGGRDRLGSDDEWGDLRASVHETVGATLLSVESIELWEVPSIPDGYCGIDEGEDSESVVALQEEEPLLSIELVEARESDLRLRAQMTAEKFINGAVAKDRIRGWIKENLDRALEGDEDGAQALSRLLKMSPGTELDVEQPRGSQADLSVQSLVEVQKMVLRRLEIDRADATGAYDHASLMNGATVLYGGKRGTSKSLIDNLPIVNRLLQQSRFRFYGFGPEAALTSTFPRNALGQCWSFHQTTLEEQLKERELYLSDTSTPDDFKRGNFGTLTVRLPTPVWVSSVVIEHPPMRLTDQSDSAISSFRVVGYEDVSASSQAWNLGSFQYDIQRNRRNEYLQEFEVPSVIFGKEVPALQSISLAVDSNWGHDYACLYRFRVHGEERRVAES